MKKLYQVITESIPNLQFESIFDDEEELGKGIDDEVTGLKPALRCLKYYKKTIFNHLPLFVRGDVNELIDALSFEDFINFYIRFLKCKEIEDFTIYFVKILYKYGEDMFQKISTNNRGGFNPKYHKEITRYDEWDLKRWGFKNYNNVTEWTAWSDPLCPSDIYMLKSIKSMSRDEQKFISELLKTICE